MENLIYNEHEYRLKPMNAIEAMAIRTQINFDTFDNTNKLFKLLLEKMEVLINEKWLPVKEKDREVYYPNGIENDASAINELLNYCLSYFKEVFQKSNESKQEQE